jgi:hypothetical protein
MSDYNRNISYGTADIYQIPYGQPGGGFIGVRYAAPAHKAAAVKQEAALFSSIKVGSDQAADPSEAK